MNGDGNLAVFFGFENIGLGVKSSTFDLLMNNCDEFIFYDDLAQEAIDLVIQTTAGISTERGDRTKLWGSMVK